MAHYYDPHPTLLLPRPVVLVGFMGCTAARTAMAVGMLTGLNPVDIEVLVAHHAGRGVRQGPWPGGIEALNRARRQALDRALRDRPYGVIAPRFDLLADPDARRRIHRDALVVYLCADLLTLYGRVLDELDRDPGRYTELLAGRPASPHDLKPRFDLLRPLYEQAELTLLIGHRHPDSVARELVERLG